MEITLEKQQQSQELYQQLVEKAWESVSFKEQLINDPITVISSFRGVDGSKYNAINFSVEDQTDPNTIYLNIPRKIEENGETQLSDEQLDLVSGGEGVLIVLGVATLGLALFGAGIALYAASHNHCD